MQGIRSWLVPIAAAIALSAGAEARALTLADLDAGGSFGVGALTFSDFDVVVAGDVSADLSAYPVQLLADGFRLSGPLSALLGEQATVLLSYTVEAATSFAITGASLFAPLVAAGAGSAALVSDSLLDAGGDPVAELLALRVAGAGAPILSDGAGFPAVSKLEVVKVIQLTTGIFAAAPHVDQRFFAVPEPLTLMMLASGLTGLTVAGRRRALVA